MLSGFQACRYCRRRIETPAKMTGRPRLPVYSRLITGGLAIPVAVTVVIVVQGVMVVAVMVVDLMMVAAVIIAVPPATRLGIVRGDYASE